MKCPFCDSHHILRDGFDEDSMDIWRCMACGETITQVDIDIQESSAAGNDDNDDNDDPPRADGDDPTDKLVGMGRWNNSMPNEHYFDTEPDEGDDDDDDDIRSDTSFEGYPGHQYW